MSREQQQIKHSIHVENNDCNYNTVPLIYGGLLPRGNRNETELNMLPSTLLSTTCIHGSWYANDIIIENCLTQTEPMLCYMLPPNDDCVSLDVQVYWFLLNDFIKIKCFTHSKGIVGE